MTSPTCQKCDCVKGCQNNPSPCPILLAECIKSGQVSAYQIEQHRVLDAAIAQPKDKPAINYTYASTQKTKCAGCGLFKHTPLRVDKMGGYVCLTCIDKELEFLLDAFIEAEPVAWRKTNSDGFYRYYEADEDQPAGCEPLYENPIAQPKDKP